MLNGEFLPVDKILARKRDSIQNFPTLNGRPKSQQTYTFSLPSFSTHLIPAFTSISSLQALDPLVQEEAKAAAIPSF